MGVLRLNGKAYDVLFSRNVITPITIAPSEVYTFTMYID